MIHYDYNTSAGEEELLENIKNSWLQADLF